LVANERNNSAGGRSMGVIADKIKDNKLFYSLLFVEEISYFNLIAGLILGYSIDSVGRSGLAVICVIASFIMMFLVHVIFFISSFFHSKIKIMRKNTVMFFLFRLILIIMCLVLFAHFE